MATHGSAVLSSRLFTGSTNTRSMKNSPALAVRTAGPGGRLIWVTYKSLSADSAADMLEQNGGLNQAALMFGEDVSSSSLPGVGNERSPKIVAPPTRVLSLLVRSQRGAYVSTMCEACFLICML
jgi:hypothetical protein